MRPRTQDPAPAHAAPVTEIKPYWRNSIPALPVATAARLLGISVDTVRKHIRTGQLDALRWHNGTWRVSARTVAQRMHDRDRAWRMPPGTVYGDTPAASLHDQTLRLGVLVGELEPRATIDQDGNLMQLYTVPHAERKYHAYQLRRLRTPATP